MSHKLSDEITRATASQVTAFTLQTWAERVAELEAERDHYVRIAYWFAAGHYPTTITRQHGWVAWEAARTEERVHYAFSLTAEPQAEAADLKEVPYDPSAPPIEETLAELAAEVPAEEWDKVPPLDVLLDPMSRVGELEAELAQVTTECDHYLRALDRLRWAGQVTAALAETAELEEAGDDQAE